VAEKGGEKAGFERSASASCLPTADVTRNRADCPRAGRSDVRENARRPSRDGNLLRRALKQPNADGWSVVLIQDGQPNAILDEYLLWQARAQGASRDPFRRGGTNATSRSPPRTDHTCAVFGPTLGSARHRPRTGATPNSGPPPTPGWGAPVIDYGPNWGILLLGSSNGQHVQQGLATTKGRHCQGGCGGCAH